MVDATGKLTASNGITTTAINATTAVINTLSVDTITAKKVVVGGALDDEDETVGSQQLLAGTQKIMVENKNITATSRVFVTVTTEGGTYLVVSQKVPGVGFEVSAPSPVALDTTFDYWIVGGE